MEKLTLSRFNAALESVGGRGVSAPKWQAFTQFKGAPYQERLLVGIASGDASAKNILKKYGMVLQVWTVLQELNFNTVKLPDVVALLQAHSVQDVRKACVDAKNGQANALSVLGRWLCDVTIGSEEASEQTGGAPHSAGKLPDEASNSPIASMPPPGGSSAPAQRPSQQRAAAYVAPPVGPTGQVTRASRTNEARGSVDQSSHRGNQARAEHHVQQSTAPAQADRKYDQAKAFGRGAALTFAADETRGNEPTVTIEAAAALQERKYDWGNKLRFQLVPWELQIVLAVIWGLIPGEVRLSNHNDKWLSMINQDEGNYAGTIKFTLGQGKATEFRPRTVQVGYQDRGEIEALFIRRASALLRVPMNAVIGPVRNTAKAYLAQQNKRRA